MSDIDYQVEVYPGVDKQGFDVHSRGEGMGWRSDEASAYRWGLGIANDNIATLQARISELETAAAEATRDRDRMREALKPFAEAGKTIKELPPLEVELAPNDQLVLDDNIIKVYGIGDTVTIGDFMNATKVMEVI